MDEFQNKQLAELISCVSHWYKECAKSLPYTGFYSVMKLSMEHVHEHESRRSCNRCALLSECTIAANMKMDPEAFYCAEYEVNDDAHPMFAIEVKETKVDVL